MRNFLLGLATSAIALWVAVQLVPGVSMVAYAPGAGAAVVTYLVVALIFGVVNALIGTLVRIATFCLYVVTLGLFGLLVNGFLFWLVGAISGQLGWGLVVDGFWWGVLGALVMAVASALLGALTAGLRRRAEEPR